MSASPPATDSPTSRKRTFDDVDRSPSKDPVLPQSSLLASGQVPLPTPPPAFASAPGSTASSRLTSPTPSSTAASITGDSPSTGQPHTAPEKLTLPAYSMKRRKLTVAEKETRRVEKEAEVKQRAEEKAKKEEAKRVQDEERRRKREAEEEKKRKREHEAARKKAIKDAEIAKKEEEKRKKEEEKNKKERSQLRLNSFFTKPAPSLASPASADSSRRSSLDLGPVQDLAAPIAPASNVPSPTKTKLSDYEKAFPSFYVHSHTSLAPINRFAKDEEAVDFARARIDSYLKDTPYSLSAAPPPFNPYDIFSIRPYTRGVNKGVSVSVKDILVGMQGFTKSPIDLTESSKGQALKKVPMKIIQLEIDVEGYRTTRPAYKGTFTKAMSPQSTSRLSRNPFSRALPETDYDYDSEAEWEEPEEGEDLDSEVEEDASEDGDEEMDGFLDDEDDVLKAKRRLVVGDMQPCTSGLCWEDSSQRWKTGNPDFDLNNYRLELILGSANTPIDPFSTHYWPAPQSSRFETKSQPSTTSSMNPPRVPLHAINQTNAAVNATHLPTISDVESATQLVPLNKAIAQSQSSKAAAKPKRIIADDLLPHFKRAVEGSNLTKAGLIEVLKKQFPKVSKDVIKDTINVIAIREGRKEEDKRWVIVSTDAAA